MVWVGGALVFVLASRMGSSRVSRVFLFGKVFRLFRGVFHFSVLQLFFGLYGLCTFILVRVSALLHYLDRL